MPNYGGLPGKGATKVKDPKKVTNEMSKKSYGLSSVNSKKFDKKIKVLSGEPIDKPRYCWACLGTSTIIVDDVNL